MTEDHIEELGRVSIGNAEADRVLHGGFPAHSINIVMGAPGTGKTILAQQMLFHNAGGERPVVYLTTLSEPLSKVLTFLQRLDFYDESTMLDSVIYEDVGQPLIERGTEFIVERVGALIRELRPRLLVIDSFKAIHDLADSPNEMREVTYRLGATLSAYDVTTFLIGEYVDEDFSARPEFALADGVVQLERRGSDRADERYLRVLKLRGSGYMEGQHAFRVSARGIEVFPRLVTPKVPSDYAPQVEKVETGISGLDELTGGGLWRGSTTLVQGTAGTGKTTLGLGFVMDGVRRGEPSLFLNLQEHPIQLAESIRRLGGEIDELRERGLHLQYVSPVELTIDSLVVEMFRIIRKHGIRRLVIDGLTEIRWSTERTERFHDYVYAMTQHFRVGNVTALLTMEAPPGGTDHRHYTRVSALCDALIALRHPGEIGLPHRSIRVIKMRAAAHPLDSRPFEIGSSGVRVLPGDESHA
jgi:circadian clock protein KaiC